MPCRAANSAYRPRPLVDARPARAYLKRLAAATVGLARAAMLSGLARSELRRIRAGAVPRIRQATAVRILAIPRRPALGTLVPAVEARRKVRQLLLERVTRAQMARAAGYQTPRLQLGRRAVTLRTALRIRALHRRWMGVAAAEGEDSRLDRVLSDDAAE